MGMTEQISMGVGAELRRAREAAGLGIEHVAEQLRFAPRQVESLERERFDRLPGPTIARGMVRNYARLLKLDPEPLVERMAPPGSKAPDPARIAARPGRQIAPSAASRRSTRLYVGFSLVLLALVGAVAYQSWRDKAAPAVAVPAEPKRAEPAEPKRAEPAAAAQAPAPVPAEAPPAAPAEPPAAAERPAQNPVEQAASETPQAVPAGADLHRLVLRMEDEAWLEVRDAGGANLVSSLNPAGSERAVRGRPPFQLVIGNARHVQLTYDGEPVDLAPHIRGEVARFTLP